MAVCQTIAALEPSAPVGQIVLYLRIANNHRSARRYREDALYLP